ncbi:MAG TPA: hypothetical protein VLA64_00150 [Azonexus sp.]|nr:hypothetical protein [Azonexus sp.]
MHPIHDFDVLLLLATALSSKRRPAQLVEIVAAADLIQEAIPAEAKLIEAFARLAINGLIIEIDGGFALTPDAQVLVNRLPRKADAAERMFIVRDKLSEYNAKATHAPILLTMEQLKEAIAAHKLAGESTAKNLLVPKPKPVEEVQRPGQRQRRPAPARQNKPAQPRWRKG